MSFITPRDGWDDPPPRQLQPVRQEFIQPPQPIQYVYAPQPQYASSYLTCKVCDRGALSPKTVWRMSTPVVVIGFVLLIPSVLGILGSILMLLGFVSTANAVASPTTTKRAAIASMRRAGVPRPVITAVLAGETAEVNEWLNSDYGGGGAPPEFQQEAVRQAQSDMTGHPGASGALLLFGGGFSVFTGIMCFVGGLLGWLLVMRKRVLQCGLCSAVVNAS